MAGGRKEGIPGVMDSKERDEIDYLTGVKIGGRMAPGWHQGRPLPGEERQFYYLKTWQGKIVLLLL